MNIKLSSFIITAVVISFLFPIGGLLIIIILALESKNSMGEEINLYMEDDLSDINYLYYPDVDVNKESDIISLEDALEISDLDYRRKAVLDVLKRNNNDYSKFLNLAIRNEDLETTHYAATSIMDTKRSINAKIRETKKAYGLEEMESKAIIDYIDLLLEQLKIPYLAKQIKEVYIREIVMLLRKIVDNKVKVEERYMIKLIEFLLELEDYKGVNYYCKLFMDEYPNTEEKYLTLLHGYYTMKDDISFQTILLLIKQNKVSLSKEGRDIIEFWIGGKS